MPLLRFYFKAVHRTGRYGRPRPSGLRDREARSRGDQRRRAGNRHRSRKGGQTAEVTIPALPSKCFEGKVRVINVSADPQTRTYMTRIVVPNPDHALRVGMVAEARIEGDRLRDLMMLPAETILRDPQGATIVFVYYPKQGRVYSRRVETGGVYGREIAIKSGLSGDEAIVFAGQDKLRDGTPVSLVGKIPPVEHWTGGVEKTRCGNEPREILSSLPVSYLDTYRHGRSGWALFLPLHAAHGRPDNHDTNRPGDCALSGRNLASRSKSR